MTTLSYPSDDDEMSVSLGSYRDFYKDLPPQIGLNGQGSWSSFETPPAPEGVNDTIKISDDPTTPSTQATTVVSSLEDNADLPTIEPLAAPLKEATNATRSLETNIVPSMAAKIESTLSAATESQSTHRDLVKEGEQRVRGMSTPAVFRFDAGWNRTIPYPFSFFLRNFCTVAVRLKPLQQPAPQQNTRRRSAHREERVWSVMHDADGVPCISQTTCDSRKGQGNTAFSFDTIFGEDVATSQVYQNVGKTLVDSVVKGRHGTIFAYGQTGSGKTFTMQGDNKGEAHGIVQMAAIDLFQQIDNLSAEREYIVRAQCFEIYNEQVRDLLKTASSGTQPRYRADKADVADLPVLTLRDDPKDGSATVNAYEEKVSCVEDIVRLLQQGSRNRACAATSQNAQSSRSHAIFRLTVESRDKQNDKDPKVRVACLNMVDLAGSENSAQARVFGARKMEGGKINQRYVLIIMFLYAL